MKQKMARKCSIVCKILTKLFQNIFYFKFLAMQLERQEIGNNNNLLENGQNTGNNNNNNLLENGQNTRNNNNNNLLGNGNTNNQFLENGITNQNTSTATNQSSLASLSTDGFLMDDLDDGHGSPTGTDMQDGHRSPMQDGSFF